ncbi:MAG: permease prefix domain 1-containing protein, partial [Acidobacteriota bacterium]
MGLLSRILGVFRAEDQYAELDDEMRFHIEERTEELIAEGLSESEARKEALRRFGHVSSMREEVRDADVSRNLEALVYDLRYGARQLRLN